ncbi:hypothetical protein BCR34DRAFT_583829 [Clohesyomyces aquaticus]|uniref:Uncharacterized protein n=1 Tax=Clohesyomyces aquaticus TaxID=1231657 RepID=A0A1Y2A3G9_9PLEO|nr:hypothetical protein BCR34DRAFT_583829 [Clohesyomyces aquaticus]
MTRRYREEGHCRASNPHSSSLQQTVLPKYSAMSPTTSDSYRPLSQQPILPIYPAISPTASDSLLNLMIEIVQSFGLFGKGEGEVASTYTTRLPLALASTFLSSAANLTVLFRNRHFREKYKLPDEIIDSPYTEFQFIMTRRDMAVTFRWCKVCLWWRERILIQVSTSQAAANEVEKARSVFTRELGEVGFWATVEMPREGIRHRERVVSFTLDTKEERSLNGCEEDKEADEVQGTEVYKSVEEHKRAEEIKGRKGTSVTPGY